MIGRDDIVLRTCGLGRLRALDICAQTIRLQWRNAIFQNGTSAKVYDRYGAVPWGSEPEIFVYRDRAALDHWDEFEAHPDNANTMIYLLAYEESQITVVVDDATAKEMAALLSAMRRAIRTMLMQLSPLERAA